MTYTKRAIHNSSIVFLLLIISTIIGYLFRIYLSRNLAIEQFGLFYAALAFIALFTTFQGFGTSTSLIKFIPEFIVKKKYSDIKSSTITTFLIHFSFVLVFTIIVMLFSNEISLFLFKTTEGSTVLNLLILSLLFSSFYIIFQLTFQGFQKMKTYAMVEPIRISLTFIAAYFLIELKVTGVAYSYLIAAVLTSIIFFPPFLHLFKRFSNVKIQISKELTKKLVMFGFPVFLGTIAIFTVNYIDTIMLSIFTSLDNVGLYQVALPTSQILWVFALAASTVLFPFISELYARNEKKPVEENISFFAHIIFFITIPFAVILFTFPEIIINLLFGYNYILAANPLRILVIGSLFYSFFYLFQNSLIAIGKPSINTKIIFKMSLFNFIFNLFLIPVLGIIGAAITSAASFLIGAILSYKALKSFVAIKMSFNRFVKIASSAVITVFVIFLIKDLLVMENLWLEAVVSLLLGFFVYILLIFTTKAVTRQDLKHLKRVGFPLPKWI